jgi:hypothetical protein
MSKDLEVHASAKASAGEPSKPQVDHELPAKRREKLAKALSNEVTYEPSEEELAVVAECQYHGAPETVDYLDQNDASTISASHQYYVIRFTRLSADIPPDPNAPPPDPLNPVPPPPPKDRVYEIASMTLRARPGSALQGMEQQGLIQHPTQAEIDEAAGQRRFLDAPRPRPQRPDGKHLVEDKPEPPLLTEAPKLKAHEASRK